MGVIASERVFKVLDNPDITPIPKPGAYAPLRVNGKVEFSNVSFSYVPGRPVLNNISFLAEPGQTVALVGHTGSGKSTIISLLTKLYPIENGVIKIDDVSIDDFDINALRKNVGIVLQDVFLFSDTVANNISFGKSGVDKSEIVKMYKSLDIMDLFEITRSCEGTFENITYETYTKGQQVPTCGECFWCKEREWAIEQNQ